MAPPVTTNHSGRRPAMVNPELVSSEQPQGTRQSSAVRSSHRCPNGSNLTSTSTNTTHHTISDDNNRLVYYPTMATPYMRARGRRDTSASRPADRETDHAPAALFDRRLRSTASCLSFAASGCFVISRPVHLRLTLRGLGSAYMQIKNSFTSPSRLITSSTTAS